MNTDEKLTRARSIMRALWDDGFREACAEDDVRAVLLRQGLIDKRSHLNWIRLLVALDYLVPFGKGRTFKLRIPASLELEAFDRGKAE